MESSEENWQAEYDHLVAESINKKNKASTRKIELIEEQEED